MQAVQSGLADVTVLDAGDVYTAGLQYTLIPFMSEIYNLGVPEYYVIAVAKEEDPSTELTYLKGKQLEGKTALTLSDLKLTSMTIN